MRLYAHQVKYSVYTVNTVSIAEYQINILRFSRIMMIVSLFIQMRHCPVVVFYVSVNSDTFLGVFFHLGTNRVCMRCE